MQLEYWKLLKDAKWNTDRVDMPQYSVLEAIIVNDPNFGDLASLTAAIEQKGAQLAEEIIGCLRNKES